MAAVAHQESEDEADVENGWGALHREAQELIALVGAEPDPTSLDELESFWGQPLAALGEDWEELLDTVHEMAEQAEESQTVFHHSGQMYWLVLDRCYEALLGEEPQPLYEQLFRECLSCLRATRTLQESLAREALEKGCFGVRGLSDPS